MKNLIKVVVVMMVMMMAITVLVGCEMFDSKPTTTTEKPEPEQPVECEHEGGAATCEEAAICTKCGESYGEALGHKKGFTASVEPTCTETGLSSSQYCSVCGKVFVEAIVIPANGHSWIDATCTAAKTCSVCGETEGDPLGHLFDAEGKCACGHVNALAVGEKNKILVTGQTLNDYGLPISWVAFTAEEKAVYTFTGSDSALVFIFDAQLNLLCGGTGSATLEAGMYLICIGNGKIGEINVAVAKTAAPHEHVWVDATCTAAKTCSVCGETEGDPLPHTEEVVPGKAATCTETGLTDGKKCSVCGATLLAQEEIPVIPHTEEVVLGKAATCTEAGLTDGKKCSVCGETLLAQEEIPALGHDYTVSYRWSDDHSACTATEICGRNADHIGATETATVIAIDLEVTATTVKYTYKVEFADSKFEGQTYLVDATVEAVDGIVTVNAPAIAGRVASHDYVKFGFIHDPDATQRFTISYSELDVWDGTSVSTGLAGSGTAEDPFLIQSAADFAYFAGQLNAAAVGQNENFSGQFIKMTKSIDLGGNLLIAGNHSGWNKYQGFGGTFDGNNCTIRGINVKPTTGTSSALFGCITKAGTLKNLIVYGNATGDGTVGGVVAYQLGKVDNVTSYVTVTATAGTIGGVVANQEGSSGALTNSVNYGSVTSPLYIIGGVAGSGGATITNCVNWGSVQGGSEAIGGIAGTTKDKGTISDCYNYGSVKTTATDKGMIGGIAGKCLKPVLDCYNFGTITGANTTGGIVGSTTKAVSNCYNYGTVNASSWLIGGIAGSVDAGANVTGCKNYGDITSTGDCVGGIVGSSKAIVSDCENYGTIKGTGRSAGIAYYSSGTIENCVNNGNVIGGWDLGGILAWVGDGQSATIKNCTNNGDVTGTWNNGGIFGLAHDNAGTVTITGCTNNGHIKSTTGGQITIAVKGVITECTENGSWTKAE